MRIKKSFIIICLIICLFSIAGVCAADANDTAITGADDSQIELTATENSLKTVENDNVTNNVRIISTGNDEIESAQNDLDKLGTNPGKYSDLVTEIGPGGNIELQHDYYTYDEGNTISITTEYSVIDGKGAIIDMAGSNIQVFNVNVHYVTIKNLTIKNARYDGDGAAIYFNSFQGTISDCVFVNNSATGNGGAIFWDGGDTVTGCVFVNNSATEGGAVYRDSSQGSLSSCVFVNNSAADGILYCHNIYHGDNLKIIDNIFLNNDGVAISAFKDRSDDSVDYNWFGNNETNKHIKPIVKNLKLDYWLFLDATVSPKMISVYDPSTITFKLRYCNEYEVHDYDNGRLKAVSLTLTPTNGRTNTPVAYFGKYVLYYAEGSGIGTITASIEDVAYTVTVNVSDGTTFRDLNGLINSNNNDTIILDRDYTYNSSFDDGLIDGVVINRPMTIIGNGYTINATGQARIFEIRSDNVTIINITFADGYMDGQGGAIRWEGAKGNVSDCIFVNNSAGYYGGAISWHYSSGSTVSDCIFVNNSAEIGGGAFIWDISGDGVVSHCIFENNSAAIGGVIYWNSNDGAVCDCIFVNNSADDGGVMYWEQNNGNVSSCIFVNNSGNTSLIHFRNGAFGKNLSVNDNIFLNNDGAVINFEYPDSTSNLDYNWFGHNATNYMDNPNVGRCNVWLFLNATANPDTFSISEASDITFKLYAYDSIDVFEYDNSRLKEVNLTVTPANGQINVAETDLDKSVRYTPESVGFDRITATIENVAYTITVTITDGTTFFDLNRTLASNTDTITLDRDYTYNSTVDSNFKDGIVVNHTMTIIGNDYAINALNKARIFDVQADDVEIKNVSFINANTTRVGGAVVWNGANGRVYDCVFVNNTASNAGAICWYPIGGGVVSGCIFENNSADDSGAALWMGKNSEVSDSVFMNNHADAAVIVCSGNGGTVSDCSFVNNSAKGDGGAIFWDGSNDGTVSGCVFVNNSVDRSIIYFNNRYSGSNLAINNNIFLNNEGVAVSFYKSDPSSNTDYNWYGHTATDYMDNPNVDGCSVWLFLNATANPDIFPILTTSDITFKLYAYDSNDVSEYDNGLLKTVNLTVTPTRGQVNSTKVNMAKSVQYTADDSGLGYLTASIENVSYTVQLKIADGTTFWDLNNTINGNNKDTLTLDRDYKYNPLTDFNLKNGIDVNRAVILIGNDYTINAANQARIFNVLADNVAVKNIVFINAKTDNDGGAILWEGDNGIVFASSFVNNSACRLGGAILWEGDNANVSGCVFENNSVYDSEGRGGAVYLGGGNSVVSGCSFVNNSAYGGGAILWGGSEGLVSGCSFVNNSADGGGGAVLWSGGSNGAVYNCSFVNNSAGIDGGAINWVESYGGNVSECSFEDNHAVDEGGAVAWVRSNDGTVYDCSFVNNSAHDGGAIDWHLNDGGTVSDCSFVNNSADYAAAIIWDRSNNGVISRSVFVNNSDDRAVIFFFNMPSYHGLTINHNIFLNNAALAIDFVLRDSDSNADYNWFGHNATNYNSEPATENVIVNNLLFLNGTANPDSVPVFYSSDISFKLYSYNSTGIFEYDSSRLQSINLTITSTKGDIVDNAKLNETIRYDATSIGKGSVTAKIENVECTIEINNLRSNPNLSVESDEVTYTNNTVIALNYNLNATGKVNVTLKGKKHDYSFVGLDLNPTVSLGNVGADEYMIIVEYSGDEFFTDATANSTLIIYKANSTLALDNIEFDYGSVGSGEISFTGAVGVVAELDGEAIIFEGSCIPISGLDVGIYNLTVTTVPDTNHLAVNRTVTITVRKINSTVKIDDITLNYGESTIIAAITEGANGITAKIDDNDVRVINNVILIQNGLEAGNHTLTITTNPDANHNAVTETARITVNKVDSTLDVSDLEFNYDSAGYTFVSFNGAVGVNVEVVDHPEAIVSVVGNKITISGLNVGIYNLAVTTIPDENHNAVTETIAVTVNKADSSVDVCSVVLYYGESVGLDVSFDGAVGVVAELDGEAIIFEGNSIPVSGLDVGVYNLTVTTIPDDNHNAVSKTVTVTVNKVDSEISIADSEIKLNVNDNQSAGASLVLVDGELTYVSSNESVATVVDGVIIAHSEGTAVITVSYAGDNNYNAAEDKTITVTIAEMFIVGYDVNMTYEDGSAYMVQLVDKYDNPIAKAKETINITIHGRTYTRLTDENGIAKVTIHLNASAYPATAQYGKITINNMVTVNKLPIVGYDVNMTYKDGSAYMVQLVDQYGNPFAKANEAVNITIAGKTYTRYTNADGVAKITINLGGGIYPVTAQYGNTIVNNVVSVYKLSISASDVSMTYRDGSAYMVQLVDQYGNPYAKANEAINITIAGKTYTRYTNDEGVVKITINLAAGTYDVTAQYGDTILNNVVTVNRYNIVASDVNMTYKDGSAYMVQLVDGNGDNVAKANVAVNITIDGKTYTRVTDANGVAKITINLHAGEYPVTAQRGNVFIENVVTVNNKFSIAANDLNMSYRDGSAFEVQLVDENGSPCALANEAVKITVAGKTYTRSTNENGVARIVINLAAGTYPVTTEYNNKTISNTITVNKT